MSNKKKRYRIRARNGQITPGVSAAKIIDRIERGKYRGDEHIAEEPDGQWQKLSSVPMFFDALMKELYSGQYVIEASKKGVAPGSKPKTEQSKKPEGATHQATVNKGSEKTSHVTPPTKHIHPSGDFEGTIDQALIKELFDGPTGTDRKNHQEPEDSEPLSKPLPKEKRSLKERFRLRKPLDIQNPKEGEEGKVRLDRKQSRRRRRLMMWAGVAILVLYFASGTKDTASVIPKAKRNNPYAGVVDQEQKEEKITGLFNEGIELYKLDNFLYYSRAADLFREVLSLDKNNVPAMGYLAQSLSQVFLQQGGDTNVSELKGVKTNKESILKVLEAGRRVDPHYSAFYRVEALLALGDKNIDLARKTILKAIETDPTGPENAVVLGEISLALKDYKTAKAALNESVSEPTVQVKSQNLLARASLEQGNLVLALKHTEEALKINPLHYRSHVLMGDITFRQKRIQPSLKSYKKAASFARFAPPKASRTLFLKMAKLYELNSQKALAKDSYRLAYFVDKETKLDNEKQRLDLNEKSLQKLGERRLLTTETFNQRGKSLVDKEDYESAFRHFLAAHVLDPDNSEILIELGDTVEKKAIYYQDFLRVKLFYERAIFHSPRDPEGYIRLGLLETEHYDFERAYRLLSQAKALDPNNRNALVAMGKHFYYRQDYNRALDEFIAASNINEKDSEILFYAGKMRLLFSRDPRAAMTLFERSYKIDPTNYSALAEWLKLKVITFDKPFALKFINNLIEIEPMNPKYYWVKGEVHAANKDFEQAEEYLKKSLDIDNKGSEVRLSLARVLDELGERRRAIAEYRLASRLDRRKVEGYSRAAALLLEVGSFDEAKKVLDTLLEVSPRYPGAQRALSAVYVAKKEPLLAEEALRVEVSNNPQNAKFRIELAELYMSHSKYVEAIEELTEISNLPPLSQAPEFVYDKVRAYLLLSQCYRQLRQFESAEGAIRLALSIDEGDPALQRELGYVYVGLQRNKDAASAFNNYLRRKPAAEDAKKVKQLIDKLVIPE